MSANGDLHQAAAALVRHFGPLQPTSWKWREVGYGPCVRCRWPSHTQAGGVPVHPFCYLNPDPPSAWNDWLLRRDGDGDRKRPDDLVTEGERQWCATERRWFTATDQRLTACVDHAAEMTARWVRNG